MYQLLKLFKGDKMQTASDILAKIDNSVLENKDNEKIVDVLEILKDSVKNVVSHLGDGTPPILIESNVIATLHIIKNYHDPQVLIEVEAIMEEILA